MLPSFAGSSSCVSLNKVCDFSRDCPNGEDEGSCVEVMTNFLNGDLGNWLIDVSDTSRRRRRAVRYSWEPVQQTTL